MVSTRPSPAPPRGRVAYPSADNYTPGDSSASPAFPAAAPTHAAAAAESSSSGGGGGTGSGSGSGSGGIRRFRSPRDPSSEGERERSLQGLKTWWKSFSGRPQTQQQQLPRAPTPLRPVTVTMNTRKVFGTDLSRVLPYASTQISTAGPNGNMHIWGDVPIVVARCGNYLKTNALDIEGVFRISGSTKRMRDLQAIFDEGPDYGRDINWRSHSFTPHDVATIFRRYLTQLPDPVIPFAFYNQFRNVQANPNSSTGGKIREYKALIRSMPLAHQYLFIYVLDLLAVFARSSDKNLMTPGNLAVIFQPGLLSHPAHDLRPREAALSKDVIEFLITQQDYFIFGISVESRRAHQSSAGNSDSIQPSPNLTSAPVIPAFDFTVDESEPVASPTFDHASPLSPNPGTASPTTVPTTSRVSSRRRRPKGVRADTDYMLPSDSDDEAPAGGYYIVESSPRAGSPVNVALPSAKPIQALLAPPDPALSGVRRSTSARTRTPGLNNTTAMSTANADLIDPSDSDDDAPSGGYVVYENKRAAGGILRGASGRSKGGFLGRSRTVLQSADSRTNSPNPAPQPSALSRRRTVPTKRVSDFTARVRRLARET